MDTKGIVMTRKNIIECFWLCSVLFCLATIIISTILYLFVWLPATFEANAFNKFSKIKATAWDAIWTDLKVTSQ